jgi:hypothetical protein
MAKFASMASSANTVHRLAARRDERMKRKDSRAHETPLLEQAKTDAPARKSCEILDYQTIRLLRHEPGQPLAMNKEKH